MAQSGSALGWGSSGRWFKSSRPDNKELCYIFIVKSGILSLMLFVCISLFYSCHDSDSAKIFKYQYLALGDSYTYGEGVCESCAFPVQLSDTLNTYFDEEINLLSIAQTGWTTSDLIDQISIINPLNDFDLVSLLIGVNNQFQGIPFTVYEEEFTFLLEKAILLANNDHNRVIVISIPDYSFTPFGQFYSNTDLVSNEINQYNEFASNICQQKDVYFEDITDISVLGLDQPELIASDGLHLSELTYSKIVNRIFQKASSILK